VKVAVIDSGAAQPLRTDSAVAERKNFSEDESVLDEIGHGTHVDRDYLREPASLRWG
jgi:subtilisin family serine protease